MYILTAAMSDPDAKTLTATEAILAVWRGDVLPGDVHLRMVKAEVSTQIQTQDDPR